MAVSPLEGLEAEAQAALVVFVLYWPLQEMETSSGLIVCPLAYSSHSKQEWSSLFDREFPNLSLCCVFTLSLCSPMDVWMCISVCLDLHAGGSTCPPTKLWWWQLLQDKVGGLVWTLLLARFSLSAIHWANTPEYNVPWSKCLLMIRKRNWVNVILIKQILKASRKLFALQMKHLVTNPPI